MSFEHEEDLFQELYEEWIDMVNQNIPLTPNVLSREVENALHVNQQIVTHMHNIRRHLELGEFDTPLYNPLEYQFLDRTVPRDTTRVSRSNGTRQIGMSTAVNQLESSVLSEMFQGIVEILNVEVTPRSELEDVKVVLTTDEFNSLDKLDIQKDEYGNKECNVCIESYKEGDKLTRLPCQHIFHEECIKNWLCNENVKCPICRSDTRQNPQDSTNK